jgi:hypothetical protein
MSEPTKATPEAPALANPPASTPTAPALGVDLSDPAIRQVVEGALNQYRQQTSDVTARAAYINANALDLPTFARNTLPNVGDEKALRQSEAAIRDELKSWFMGELKRAGLEDAYTARTATRIPSGASNLIDAPTPTPKREGVVQSPEQRLAALLK